MLPRPCLAANLRIELVTHPYLKPILGIELDDRSHKRQDRQERDAFVDEVFESAGLPLIHIPVRQGYQLAELTALLLPYLGSGWQSPAETQVSCQSVEIKLTNC